MMALACSTLLLPLPDAAASDDAPDGGSTSSGRDAPAAHGGVVADSAGERYVQVGSGGSFACALADSGVARCWGSDAWGQLDVPAERFSSLSLGDRHVCGVRTDGGVSCWGDARYNRLGAPDGVFESVSSGSLVTCGLRPDGEVLCWGFRLDWPHTAVDGRFEALDAGGRQMCGIRPTGALECWGHNERGQHDAPQGEFASLSTGAFHACALSETGEASCWGADAHGETSPPAGEFVDISAGWELTCGLRPGGALECWGSSRKGLTEPPAGRFTQVSVGDANACALRDDGEAVCWGADHRGQNEVPPTGSSDAVIGESDAVKSLSLTGVNALEPEGAGRFGAAVPAGTDTTTVNITPADPSAAVKVTPVDADPDTDGHQVSLQQGTTTVTVTIAMPASDPPPQPQQSVRRSLRGPSTPRSDKGDDGGTESVQYEFSIERRSATVIDDDATLGSLSITHSAGSVDFGTFDGASLRYAGSVAAEVEQVTVAASASNPDAVVTVRPADDSTDTGHQIDLATGITTVSVTVTSTDGAHVRTYRVLVNRASTEDRGWDSVADVDALWSAGGDPDPRGLWSDGETWWIADASERKILAYDRASGERAPTRDIDTAAAAPRVRPTGIWSDGRDMWSAGTAAGRVLGFDLADGERRRRLDLAGFVDAGAGHIGGLWSDGTTMWASDHSDDKVYAIDLAGGARDAAKDLGALIAAGNTSPTGIWSNGTTMWVADRVDAKLYAYDLADGARDADKDFDTLAAAGNTSPTGIWSNGATMWVADNAADKIFAYNMAAAVGLKSLQLTDDDSNDIDIGALNPGTSRYRARVPNTADTVTVAAAALDADHTVTIAPADDNTDTTDPHSDGHQIDLTDGDNTITITVTDDTITRTYTATITRIDTAALTDNTDLTALTVTDDDDNTIDIGTFNANTRTYRAQVTDTDTVTVDATPADTAAQVTITPADTDTANGHQVSLDNPINQIDITVESTDGRHQNTYTILINRRGLTADGSSFQRQPQHEITLVPQQPSNPETMAGRDGTIWVLGRYNEEKTLYAYDATTGLRAPTQDIAMPELGEDSHDAVWIEDDIVWVARSWTRPISVLAYDRATGRALPDRTITVPHFYDGSGIKPQGLWSDGDTMWVALQTPNPDMVFAFDIATGERRPEHDITTLDRDRVDVPEGLWSDGQTMWVLNDDYRNDGDRDGQTGRIFAYDLITGERDPDLDLDTLAAAGNHHPRNLWSDGETMWVLDYWDDRVYAYQLPADTRLGSLSVSHGNDDFEPLAVSDQRYRIAVPSGTETVTVTAEARGQDATVWILPADANSDATDGHQIDVTAKNNADADTVTVDVSVVNRDWADTYILAVTRSTHASVSGDAALSAITMSDITFDSFDPTVTGYELAAPHDVAVTTVSAVASDSTATVVITPDDSSEEDPGHQIELPAGQTTTVTAAVQSSDLTASREYQVRVRRGYADAYRWNALKDFRYVPRTQARVRRDGAGMWSDGTNVWIVHNSSVWNAERTSTVSAYDLATGERRPDSDIDTLHAAGNRQATGLWSDGHTMWVADRGDDKLYAYALASGERRRRLEIDSLDDAGNNRPEGIWSDGATIWVADGDDHLIYAYDLATGEHRSSLNFDIVSMPRGMWSDGTTMWVAKRSSAEIRAYDLATGDRVRSRQFGDLGRTGNYNPAGIWSDGVTMWVADSRSGWVHSYNMPASALLSSLEVSGVELGAFQPGVSAYAGIVATSTASVTVAAEAAHAGSTVTIAPADASTDAGHQVNLSSGVNTITVTVARGGDSRVYTVKVTRSALASVSGDASLSSLKLVDGDGGETDVALDQGRASYRVALPSTAATATVTVAAAAADVSATVTITPADASSDAGHQVSLQDGANEIRVDVASSNGLARGRYTLTVVRDTAAAEGWLGVHRLAPSELPTSSVPNGMRDLWSDGSTLWAAWRGGQVLAFDLDTLQRSTGSDILSLSEAGNTASNGIWSDGTVMWVADATDAKIYAYNLSDGARQADLDIDTLEGAGNDRPARIWSDRTVMWVADATDAKIYAYNLSDGARQAGLDIDTLEGAGNSDPAGLWSDGATMWVADATDAKIYAYDMSDGARRAGLDFDILAAVGNGNPKGIWSDGSVLWVSDGEESSIYTYRMPYQAVLLSLELSGVTLDGFLPGRTDHRAFAPNSAASTTVTATVPAGATAAIEPDDASTDEGHQVDLDEGDNTITVTVTHGADTRIYTVTVTRLAAGELPGDAALDTLSVDGADFGTFDPAVFSYQAFVEHSTASVTVAATTRSTGADYAVHPPDADPVTEAHEVALAIGANAITVAVTAANGDRQTYTVTVTRATPPLPSNDNALASLTLTGIDFAFDPAQAVYFVDADDELETTTVAARTRHAAATAATAGTADDADGHQATLSDGVTTIMIEVTAEDGSRRTYTIHIGRGNGDTLDHVRGDAAEIAPDGGWDEPHWDWNDLTGLLDYYTFALSSQTTIGLGLRRHTADIDLYLENAAGAIVESSANNGTAWEELTANLQPGTYYIRVQAAVASDTRYILRWGP